MPVYNPRPISPVEAERAFDIPNPEVLERNENMMMGREDTSGLPDWSSFNMYNNRGGRRTRRRVRKTRKCRKSRKGRK